jgi:spore germination protein KB
MNKKPRITSFQLLLMAVGSALVFPYTFMPILVSPPSNQDVWIVLLMSFLYIFLINLPLLFLMNKLRGMNINDMAETILGKAIGKIVMIPFVLFFLYCFTACLLITAQFINIYIFPETPTWALLVLALIPVSYASYKGAGTIGRLAVFIVPFAIGTIVLFFVLGIGKLNINIIKPILADSSFLDLNKGAFFTGARYSEILIFLVFSFFLKEDSSINKTYFSALGVFAFSFFLMLFPTILTLGIDLARHMWNPYYVYTSQVEAFNFLERVQSINALAWFPMALLKLTMYNYMASYALSGVVKVKAHKYFVIPLSVITFIVCSLPFLDDSNLILLLRSDQVFPWVILPITFILPAVFLIVYFIRRKKIEA